MLNNVACVVTSVQGTPFAVSNGLVQQMPELRVRMNPAAVPDVVCYIIAACDEFRAILKRTHRGLDADGRAALRGQKAYARNALAAVGRIIERIMSTVDLRAFDSATQDWLTGAGFDADATDVPDELTNDSDPTRQGG